MAIYHFRVKLISRSAGKSAVASAAYRHAAKMRDEKENQTWNYQSKTGVVHKELMVPDNAPDWINEIAALPDVDKASEQLWNRVEQHEKRSDAQLAREAVLALPIELTHEQNIMLVREFLKDQLVSRGMVADWTLHNEEGNPHVHVMLTMRSLEEDGFGLKVREWNKTELLKEWRARWADYANYHLQLNQHAIRIDHRSYQAQGIDLIPSVHQGKAVSDMTRRGIKTDIHQEANAIRRENLARIAKDPKVLLNKLTSQHESFSLEQLSHELGRYINDQGKFVHHKAPVFSPPSSQTPDGLIEEIHSASYLTPEAIAQILKNMEHHESVFTERHIAKAVAPYTDHPTSFATALLQVKASPELLFVGVGEDGRERFTTRRMFKVENGLQKSADQMRKSTHIKIPKHRIERALKKYEHHIGKKLSNEQVDAVKHVLKPSSISCIVGRAGTGKSFSLGAAKAAWESHGLRVQGVALSGIAADGLSKGAGVPSRTIESFRYAVQRGQIVLNARDVIIMDEAGMADSISMAAVIKIVKDAGAKLVLVGDPAQIQPVGPGATFRALLERIGFAEIQTVYRQNKPWQREATVSFSTGRVPSGLRDYAANGCIHFAENEHHAMLKLVNDWNQSRAAQASPLDQYLVIAHRNKDVFALNELLRAERIRQNEIAEGYTVIGKGGEMKISQGDRLLFLKNDRRLGVNNGRFATIKSVQFTESGKVTGFIAALDGGQREVFINPKKYGDFTHGYAATVHKVQGMTVDHALVYGNGYFWNRHLTYVAMSRHRESCHLYVSDRDMMALTTRLGRLGIKDSLLDYPLGFSERRGMDISRLLRDLPRYLAKQLTELKTRVTQKMEKLFHHSEHGHPISHTNVLPGKEHVTLEAILSHYVELELKQTERLSEMRTARLTDRKAAAALSADIIHHAKRIKAWAQEAISHPEIKGALEKLQNVKPPTLAERGGFSALKSRLENNQLDPADYQTLVAQLRNTANNQGLKNVQARDRGGQSR